jgi:hypothetical protein
MRRLFSPKIIAIFLIIFNMINDFFSSSYSKILLVLKKQFSGVERKGISPVVGFFERGYFTPEVTSAEYRKGLFPAVGRKFEYFDPAALEHLDTPGWSVFSENMSVFRNLQVL